MKNYNEFKESLAVELTQTIQGMKIEVERFYELCRTYAKILINAKIFLDKGQMCGVFGYKDSDYFISEFNKHTHDLSLSRQEKEQLFDIINDVFYDAVTDKEREKLPHGMVKEEDDSSNLPIGYWGTYYVCDHIPDDVVASIKKKLFE